MKRAEIEAVLNGLTYFEVMEVEGLTFALSGRLVFAPDESLTATLVASLGGPASIEARGRLVPEFGVYQRRGGGWAHAQFSGTPAVVIHRFADVIEQIQAWVKGDGPWPRSPRKDYDG